MVYVNHELRCENCKQKGDALIFIHIRPGIYLSGKWSKKDKIKKVCYSCVRSSYWRFCREGGYWRKVFNKPMFNEDSIPSRRVKHKKGRSFNG